MNEMQVVNTATALTAYATGRNDGFKSGVIFALGAVVVYKALLKHGGARYPFGSNCKKK